MTNDSYKENKQFPECDGDLNNETEKIWNIPTFGFHK